MSSRKANPPTSSDSLFSIAIDAVAPLDTLIVYSDENPVSILLVGDSMMGYGFGSSMMQILQGNSKFEPERHYIGSSGLSRPDFFNWPAQLQTLVSENDFDIVIVMLGTNDSQDFRLNGTYYEYGTTDWFDVYGKNNENAEYDRIQLKKYLLDWNASHAWQ